MKPISQCWISQLYYFEIIEGAHGPLFFFDAHCPREAIRLHYLNLAFSFIFTVVPSDIFPFALK